MSSAYAENIRDNLISKTRSQKINKYSFIKILQYSQKWYTIYALKKETLLYFI